MDTWQAAMQHKMKAVIETTATAWQLDNAVAARCIEALSDAGRTDPFVLMRSDRPGRTMSAGRRLSKPKGRSSGEYRRWDDHRFSDMQPGQGR